MSTRLLPAGMGSRYTLIRTNARNKARQRTLLRISLLWYIVLLVPLGVFVMPPSTRAQSAVASRVVTLTNEVNAVRPLACEVNGARSDSLYKKALVGAINDLRSAVQARIGEIQNSR